ncbi:hypothetical protein P154DRAFT_621637 [Amniculicola lignicola CBS 123094]|uniref:Transcription factor domain-containing protein n=1 Tax=Amniculicola lignicola CBS 123094 TaxID=1392246 RepID=A0A6A5WLI0_9PLEO|nr:hypothetical protein P154DRAFT_621637 [Amniculicola lignicola CBS 123094]
MSAKFTFVAVKGAGKPQGSDRTLIRSHCMQGKNKREDSRRSMKKKKKQLNAAAPEENPETLAAIHWYPTPSSNIPYTLRIDHLSQNLIYKFLMCDVLLVEPVVETQISPIENCVDFDVFETTSNNPHLNDPLFSHAMTFIRSAIQDLALVNQRPSHITYNHLSQTLALLNKDLSTEAAYQKETTLHIVIMLTLLSVVFRDWNAAGAHMNGLMRIIDLRGGASYLNTRPKMRYQIDRLTTAWTLSSGSRAPQITLPSFSWTTLCTLEPFNTHPCVHIYPLRAILDADLYAIFHDLQHIATAINITIDSQIKFHGNCFQKLISHLQYRIQHIERTLKHHVDELVCLGMLCILTTSFKIPKRKIPYTYLQDRIRVAFEHPETSPLIRLNPSAVFWVVMMGLVSVVDLDEGWVREAWGLFKVQKDAGWATARRGLMEMVWIECLHDRLGEKAYTRLMGERDMRIDDPLAL